LGWVRLKSKGKRPNFSRVKVICKFTSHPSGSEDDYTLAESAWQEKNGLGN
jgi:hypothetical protein